MRTGPATRMALAASGREAATVGGVIHLPAPPTGSFRSVEVLSHELVHAGRPSAAARFFDDDHHDGEERVARQTGGLLRAVSSREPAHGGRPEAFRMGTDHLPVRGGLGLFPTPTLRRTVDAGSLAATLAGPSRGADVRRRVEDSGLGDLAERFARAVSGSDGGSNTRGAAVAQGTGTNWSASVTASPSVQRAESDHPGSSGGDGERVSTAPVNAEMIERIVDALEERVVNELERRGLRYRPGVF
jgi:hypothetical protein